MVRRGSMTTIFMLRPLFARRRDALVEDRMAPGEVGADQDDEIGKLEILVAARHRVGAEGAAVAGDRGGHAEPRIGVDIGRADEALHQLVGDVIVLGQQLAGDIEGDRSPGRARRWSARSVAATRSSASSQPARRPSISGWSSRPSRSRVSASAEPLEQSRPKLAGWSGSPRTRHLPVRGDLREHAAADAAIGAGGPHLARCVDLHDFRPRGWPALPAR